MHKRADKIVQEIPAACADEAKAVEFLEKQRWGDSPACPHCGGVHVYQMKGRNGERNTRYLWRCHDCKQQYTVRIGTVFEESRIALRHWCYAFWAACASKKGVSALQISRMTGVSCKSTLFMMHRIRFAMTDDHSKPEPMTGTVEIDETYVGGKPRYKGQHNLKKCGRGTDKTPVVAMVQRNGNVRAQVMPKVNSHNLGEAIRENVHQSARIITDESYLYRGIGKTFEGGHDSINHSAKQYANGDITTNTVEGFFSILKRGVIGTFHNVSKEHLHRYVGEFEYRYNTRKMSDGERTKLAIQKSEGKRLQYSQPLRGRNEGHPAPHPLYLHK
jgi:transposase-like protein